MRYSNVFLGLAAAVLLASPAVQAASGKSACRICTIASVGMDRDDVEQRFAAVTGIEKTYTAYGDNLKAGLVLYRDRGWILRVTYQAGFPAPWVINKDGVGEHRPSIDAKVVKFDSGKIASPRKH